MAALSAERVAAARRVAVAVAPSVIELAGRIASVAAPTGNEHARSDLIAALFQDAGFDRIARDELGDVTATQTGSRPGPSLLVAAHLDTVFPAATPLKVIHEAKRATGPGIGDNSLGVAAAASLPALLRQVGVQPAVDVLVTGNVGEEGLGNLSGMRAVMDANPGIGAAVAVEGHSLGRITHIAVGSRRLKVTVRGPGGHSWGDAGRASAIHVLGCIIHHLVELPLPMTPKTTLNVGVIEGGISVNTIAPMASFVLDMRSVDAAALRCLGEQVEQIIRAQRDAEVRVDIDVLGERPAGVVPRESRIVRIATEALAALGVEATFDASSTDANVPISRGIPAVCLGLTTGGNVHREDEYIDLDPVPAGLAQLALVVLQVADELAAGTLGSRRPGL